MVASATTHINSRGLTFLGCPVDSISVPDTLRWIQQAVAERRPRLIAVVNANKFYQMAHNPELRRIVTQADLIVPEWAVVWGARRLGLPVPIHSGGVVIAKALLPFAAECRFRPYLLGAKPEVVSRLVEHLRSEHPRLHLAGFHHGYIWDQQMTRAVVTDIRCKRPDVLLVAMGSPAQEIWIDRHREALGVPVSIGIGGSFDVLSGLKPDTPKWARGKGLEWLYRLALEPQTYARRYAVTNTWFVWQVLRERLRRTREN